MLRSQGVRLLDPVASEAFPKTDAERDAAQRLSALFMKHGSDKSDAHDYHNVYGPILTRGGLFKRLFEVGLGTNNVDVVSNMGHAGRPGASLRAFRDYLPEALVYGADIDRRVLFSEERVETFYVDQHNLSSFDTIDAAISGSIDLIIDDGLHSPGANIAVLSFAVRKLSPGGWVVIEDIAEAALPFWRVVAELLPGWSPTLVRARGGYLFVATRPA